MLVNCSDTQLWCSYNLNPMSITICCLVIIPFWGFLNELLTLDIILVTFLTYHFLYLSSNYGV